MVLGSQGVGKTSLVHRSVILMIPVIFILGVLEGKLTMFQICEEQICAREHDIYGRCEFPDKARGRR